VTHKHESSNQIEFVNPGVAYTFTVESGTDLGARADGTEAHKQRTLVKVPKCYNREWNALLDDITRAKFAQCKYAASVLLLTGKAQLWHDAKRMYPERCEYLEDVRELLPALMHSSWYQR
jgi:hypothetical protein